MSPRKRGNPNPGKVLRERRCARLRETIEQIESGAVTISGLNGTRHSKSSSIRRLRAELARLEDGS